MKHQQYLNTEDYDMMKGGPEVPELTLLLTDQS